MSTTVRGKFFVLGIRRQPHSSGSQIELGAVSATDNEQSENTMYHRYTPSGTISLFIDNPAAEAFFSLGRTVYVDFSEAPPQ